MNKWSPRFAVNHELNANASGHDRTVNNSVTTVNKTDQVEKAFINTVVSYKTPNINSCFGIGYV